MRCMVSKERRQLSQVAFARRKASVMSQSDASEQLQTIVNGLTVSVDGHVGPMALPSLNALLELDGMSYFEFGNASKAGDLSEVVVIRPDVELNSSYLTKKNGRIRS